MQRCLCAASRTTFGGDVFFIVRDLFGGDGVVVAPLSVKRARGPVLSALDQHEDNNKGGANGGGGGGGGGGESPVEIRVVGDSSGGRAVVKIVVTSRTAYGLYADELAGSASGGGGSGGVRNGAAAAEPGRRRRRRSLTHPMITLHATLVETIPVLVTPPSTPSTPSASGQEAQQQQQQQPLPPPTLRVLARGFGAGRLLKLRAERPPSPCPSPPPIFATYPEEAAAAGGGGPMCPHSPPPPPRDNDEISV